MIFHTKDASYSVDLRERVLQSTDLTVAGLKFKYAVGIYAGSESAEFYGEDMGFLLRVEGITEVEPEGDVLAVESPDAVEPGHVIFRTENSVYEIDQEQKLVRRLAGLNEPRGHMAADLEWTEYVSLYLVVGRQAYIHWTDGKTRVTSPVRDIFGQLVEAPPAS
jgi:hypothetical protein